MAAGRPAAVGRSAPGRAELARLHGGDGTEGDAVVGSTIPEAFAAQVARHRDRPAVIADDATVTYGELGASVLATAAALPPGDTPVAVLCRHGVATVTALLAALVAGRPYVPLDPTFPTRRLATILTDSAAGVLLTDPAHADRAGELAAGRPTVHVRQSAVDGTGDVLSGLSGRAGPDDPAYVLYTSGSTGVPKGVVHSHANVLFGVANHVGDLAITPADRTSVLSSFGYDMAVTDTFSALLSGAAAVPVDARGHGLGHVAEVLARRRVTIYHSTPTVYRYLVASLGPDGRLPDIRAVLLGGEEVTRHDVTLARRHFAPTTVFVNGYGTTEISFAAQYHLRPDDPLDHAVVPIGHPLPGIDITLAGDAGEVVVRTPYVALGYLGRPELTAERFGTDAGVRTYRTGDLARRLDDGRLVYLGRADRMVKIRGHRVELGEVEAELAALDGVAQAAVVTRPRPASTVEPEIVGYVVARGGSPVDGAALRRQLATVLPEFMLPRAIVSVTELPIGPTGKLDVAALPLPSPVPLSSSPSTVAIGSSPSTVAIGSSSSPVAFGPVEGDPLVATISRIWAEVLGLGAVDPRATFFDLGGHSLELATVQRHLEAALGRRIRLTELAEHATVAALAAHLAAAPGPVPAPSPAEAAPSPAEAAPSPAEAASSPGTAPSPTEASGPVPAPRPSQPAAADLDPALTRVVERMRRRRAHRDSSTATADAGTGGVDAGHGPGGRAG